MFTRAGCQDAIDVERYTIGKIIQDNDVDKVVDAIGNITPDDCASWQANMGKLPSKVYSYTTEVDELRDALYSILRDQSVSDGAQSHSYS